ncbi:MAG: hypothetical protein M1818_003926 [Claussenomyces sp. TS43310]|nr:MAG: hypothetical protein M1818_003926 [Claussenomyces sp. TS43310]
MAPRQRTLRSDPQNSQRASRHAKPIRPYQESSEDATEEEDIQSSSDDSDDTPLAQRTPRNARHARNPSVTHRQQAVSHKPKPAAKSPKRKLSALKIQNPSQNCGRIIAAIPQDSGTIPNWAALPYEILVQIFYYASQPLCDERTFQSNDSVPWLLQMSRLCRVFAEPALTVLYRSPPLAPMHHAHLLTNLLKSEPIPMIYNYRSKIENIQMEVTQTAAYTLHGYGLLDMHGLIFNCPRLQALEIFHRKDLPPYRELDHPIKWTYPESLFAALARNLDGVPARLRSWRWNARLAGTRIPIERLKELHMTPPFRSLQRCAFVNYQVAKLKKDQEDPEHEAKLAEALSVLANLNHLILESSTLVNSSFMPLLPVALQHLDLINCWEVVSDDLSSFLLSSGSQIRSLTLNHNQSLSLSFLAILGSACPQLTSLYMDLTYFAVHSSYRDTEPLYDQLLEVHEVPIWPSSLQNIELLHLRKWDTEAAQMFFSSLLNSACNLPDLRRLVVKGILNISWRDRSEFRKMWTEPFTRVFQRPYREPNPHLRSIGAFEAHKAKPEGAQRPEAEEDDEDEAVHARSSKRPRVIPDGRPNGEVFSRRSLRSAGPRASRMSYRELSDSSDSEINQPYAATAPHRNLSTPAAPSTPSRGRRLARRELEILHRTAGFHKPAATLLISSDESDSDDAPVARRRTQRQHGESEGPQRQQQHRPRVTDTERFPYIQGMCNVVDVKIDNLRPAEMQYKEADFLDSEPEGDEDWNGDGVFEDERYAW